MKWRASMFAPARKGRISCAVKSNAKNLRGLGKERRLIFLCLVLFSRRGTGYEILTSSVYVFTTESHLPLAGHAPHVSCSFLKLFQSTEPNLISGRRQKRGWANGCHSIFCKKLVSLCLSAQERLITTRINIRVRIWVLQWEERKKRKPPRTPVKSFINFLVLTVYSVCCRCRINLTATGNVATPAETEIACRMNGYSLVYSRARFVQWTECVVFLNEGMGWVKWIVRGTFSLFRGGGGGYICWYQEFWPR